MLSKKRLAEIADIIGKMKYTSQDYWEGELYEQAEQAIQDLRAESELIDLLSEPIDLPNDNNA